MESSINIPVGAHDIFNEQDALIAFSRLIASNVDVNRWIMKLNYDYNNESTCILDLSSVPFMLELREEQKTLQKMNETDANFWYGRSLQISIRKRILKSLQQAGLFVANNNRGSSVGSRSLSSGSNSHVPTTTPGLLYICRKDIFTSWNAYANYMGVYGAVIEAEPPGDILGYLRACCYIHPLEAVGTSSSSAIVTPRNEHGRDFISVNIQDMPLEGMNQHDTADAPLSNLMQPDVEYVGGLDMIVDVNNQYQGYCYPQKQIPEEGLKGAAMSLCNYLYIKYNVIGYVEVNFLLFWDSYAHVPKMWGLDFAFGHRLSHSCCSIINHLAHRVQFDRVHHAQDDFNGKTNYDELLPILKYRKSMLYPPCEGRCCVYFPMAIQHSLKGTRDDVFYKLCGMNGIAYDHTRRIGTLFFLIDTIVGGGVVSVMCISTTRAKCLELAIDVFTFISKQFGKNSKSKQIMPEDVCWQHGHSILLNLKKCIKKIDKTKK